MAYSPPSSSLLPLLAPLLLLLFFFFTGLINASAHPNFLSTGTPRHPKGFSVILTEATSLALKDRRHGPLRLDHHDSSLRPARPAHLIFRVDGGLDDPRPFCKLFQTVHFANILHLAAAAQSNSDGFVNLPDIANTADPQPAVLWASSSSIPGPPSRINPKDQTTITSTRGLICQVDHGTALKKRIQERASFVKSIAAKQEATVGVERFLHGGPNMPEEAAINELGKGDGESEKFPHMHPLGRRLLHTRKGSSPTPALVAVSRASGPVTPSGPSPCTHIPRGDGHC